MKTLTLKRPKQSTAICGREKAIAIATAGTAGKEAELIRLLSDLENVADCKPGSWGHHARKFRLWIESGKKGIPPFSIFMAKGNRKLPFYAFSTLPVFDCPGAGACKSWCYSFKAWRYPAAFLRQLQNSLLMRDEPGRAIIKQAWESIPQGRTVRLYVDGDFFALDALRFWMRRCADRLDLPVYGYSKSWSLFLAMPTNYAWPINYLVNLSSGSMHSQADCERMERLPVVRGEFIAAPVDKAHMTGAQAAYQDKGNPGSTQYRAQVRDKLRMITGTGKVFACPGNCGNCLPNGEHACGSERMRGITIGIGIHS